MILTYRDSATLHQLCEQLERINENLCEMMSEQDMNPNPGKYNDDEDGLLGRVQRLANLLGENLAILKQNTQVHQ